MAESYEYPSTLTHYRPLDFAQSSYYPVAFKLRHHFFLTRAKIIFKELLFIPKSDLYQRNLEREIVSN